MQDEMTIVINLSHWLLRWRSS